MEGRPMQVFPERDLYEEGEEERASYASPPCFMHELDPSYLGYADAAETIAMLNDLLARGLGNGDRDAAAKAALIGGGEDEVSFQAVLRQHILRLGGRPASSASSLPKTADARCDRDRGAVLHKLREILPRIGDGWLHDDLRAMIETLDRQLRRHEESA
jgi:hypothetical protein